MLASWDITREGDCRGDRRVWGSKWTTYDDGYGDGKRSIGVEIVKSHCWSLRSSTYVIIVKTRSSVKDHSTLDLRGLQVHIGPPNDVISMSSLE
jgi:hypothetical protein